MDKTQALIDYASSLTELKPSGGRLFGCCPIHDEKTASFVINDDKFNCYGCGARGDVFDLWQTITGGTFLEAKKALGFWDHSRPAPVKKGPSPPKFEKIFKPVSKADGWTMAATTLKAGFDQEIIWNEKKYWNFQFIAECLKHLKPEEIETWIYKISGWFPIGDTRRQIVFNLISDYLKGDKE